jgi:hypothetical protein
MLFDEYYHFGLIQYFSHQWLPWINNQPTSLDVYGALGRDPYLLYHYIMSFPFRIVALFTNKLAVQVISMRIINIGLFAGGLIIFARLFNTIKIKPVFRNIALLFFILLPVTPFIAATVNYDNATFLLTALFMLVGVRIIQSKTIKWHDYALIVLIGMIGSLTKVSFLPIFAAGFIFLLVRLLIKNKGKVTSDFTVSFKNSNTWVKIAVLILLVIVGGFFVERFGINIVQYHSLNPDCTSQMTEARCLTNGIISRDNIFLAGKTGTSMPLRHYSKVWFEGMVGSSSFSGSSTSYGTGQTTAPPLPIIYTLLFFGTIVSAIVLLYSFFKIKKIPGFWFLTAIISLYLVSLFYTNAATYYKFYVADGVQGRYLLPLLPIIMVFTALGVNYALRKMNLLKLVILILVFLLFLNGAGVITHIMRSNDSWDWNNKIVRQVNDDARNLLRPFIKE